MDYRLFAVTVTDDLGTERATHLYYVLFNEAERLREKALTAQGKQTLAFLDAAWNALEVVLEERGILE